MATATYKILGQANPAVGVANDVYTAPASSQTVVSSVTVCNLGNSCTYSILLRVAGAAANNQQYIAFQAPLNQYDSAFLSLGLTLGATDVLTVNTSGNNSITVCGTVIQ